MPRATIARAQMPMTALRRLIAAAAGSVMEWRFRRRSRIDLRRLDDRLLKDIGVTRPEAEIEARRLFWDYR